MIKLNFEPKMNKDNLHNTMLVKLRNNKVFIYSDDILYNKNEVLEVDNYRPDLLYINNEEQEKDICWVGLSSKRNPMKMLDNVENINWFWERTEKYITKIESNFLKQMIKIGATEMKISYNKAHRTTCNLYRKDEYLGQLLGEQFNVMFECLPQHTYVNIEEILQKYKIKE